MKLKLYLKHTKENCVRIGEELIVALQEVLPKIDHSPIIIQALIFVPLTDHFCYESEDDVPTADFDHSN